MKITRWTNEDMGVEYFLSCNRKEMRELSEYYDAEFFESFSFENNDYYYFLSSKNHTITPMRMASDGFAGQYNGYQFEDLDEPFDFNQEEYEYQFDLPFFQSIDKRRQEKVVKSILKQKKTEC